MMEAKQHTNRRATNVKENYVVKHEIENMQLWFCLNCDEWIQDKTQVLKKDWTLFDQIGDLRRDV